MLTPCIESVYVLASDVLYLSILVFGLSILCNMYTAHAVEEILSCFCMNNYTAANVEIQRYILYMYI